MFELIRDFDAFPPANREELRRFLAESWMETYPEQMGLKTAEFMVSRLASADLDGLLSPGTRVILFRREGRIVASCFYGPGPKGAVWFWGLYVLRSAQRQGLGRRMLEEILILRPQTRILLATVLTASRDALRFYSALDFAMVEETSYELAPGHVEPALLLEWRAAKPKALDWAILSVE